MIFDRISRPRRRRRGFEPVMAAEALESRMLLTTIAGVGADTDAGAGGGPHVKVFDGLSPNAASDGMSDIITTAGRGLPIR